MPISSFDKAQEAVVRAIHIDIAPRFYGAAGSGRGTSRAIPARDEIARMVMEALVRAGVCAPAGALVADRFGEELPFDRRVRSIPALCSGCGNAPSKQFFTDRSPVIWCAPCLMEYDCVSGSWISVLAVDEAGYPLHLKLGELHNDRS